MTRVTHYKWESRNLLGEKINGIIEAKSLILAKLALRKQGITAQKIEEKRAFLLSNFGNFNKKIKSHDIHQFIRHISTLNKAGIPLLQSLTILENGTKNPQLNALIVNIKNDINTGVMLAESLNKYPIFFSSLVCNMISTGEQSGTLDIMLEKIILHQERITHLKQTIRRALSYPMAVMFIAMIVTTGLLLFVIPEFESLFISFGAELPLFTRMILNLSTFVNTYGFILLSIGFVMSYAGMYSYKRVPKFSHYLQSSLLKLPALGSLLKKACIARFSRTLAITFAAGIPLTHALNEAAGCVGNSLYAKGIFNIREDVSNGQSMHHAMQRTHLFSTVVIQMVAIGEESGSLDHMFNKVADHIEEEMNHTITLLSSLLEPVIMAVLGLLVGSLVIAMYLPILKLGTGV